MELSPMVAEWVAAYEQEHGFKPAELLIQIAEHIVKVSDMLRQRGREDVQKGKQAPYADDFHRLVIKAFQWDLNTYHDTAQAVADLWRDNYMDGYTSLKASA